MIITARLYGYVADVGQYKVLVDRLWPRGVSKENAIWDKWMKEIAPSNELRQWFGHDVEKWNEFKKKYKLELAEKESELYRIRKLEQEHDTVVLLYAAKDSIHNQANVIKEFLMNSKL